VYWSSSDESVATISESGLVKGLKVGETIITATAKDDSGVTYKVPVTVKEEKSIDLRDLVGEERNIKKDEFTFAFDMVPVLVFKLGTYKYVDDAGTIVEDEGIEIYDGDTYIGWTFARREINGTMFGFDQDSFISDYKKEPTTANPTEDKYYTKELSLKLANIVKTDEGEDWKVGESRKLVAFALDVYASPSETSYSKYDFSRSTIDDVTGTWKVVGRSIFDFNVNSFSLPQFETGTLSGGFGAISSAADKKFQTTKHIFNYGYDPVDPDEYNMRNEKVEVLNEPEEGDSEYSKEYPKNNNSTIKMALRVDSNVAEFKETDTANTFKAMISNVPDVNSVVVTWASGTLYK
jgi:hypothetical protein